MTTPGAAGQAHEGADEHIDDGGHGAYGGEGLLADEVAHHPGIHHVVHLLKEVPRQQGQGKQEQVGKDVPLGHVYIVPASFFKLLTRLHVCLLLSPVPDTPRGRFSVISMEYITKQGKLE